MLYDQFPRQVAIPYRINCNNESEFIEEINKYNGHKRVFTSVYNFNTTEEDTEIILDKVFFDFDGENAYNSIVSAYEYLKEHNLKFTMFFSGGGFHLYIFLKNYEHLNNKKATLINIQYHFKNIITYQVDNDTITEDEKGRQTLYNTGTGEGYYITNGYAVKIKWSKASREAQTKYTYLDGTEINVSDGNTFIQIQPKGENLKISGNE